VTDMEDPHEWRYHSLTSSFVSASLDSPRIDTVVFARPLISSETSSYLYTSPRGATLGPSRSSSSFARSELRLALRAMAVSRRVKVSNGVREYGSE